MYMHTIVTLRHFQDHRMRGAKKRRGFVPFLCISAYRRPFFLEKGHCFFISGPNCLKLGENSYVMADQIWAEKLREKAIVAKRRRG